MVRNGVAAVSLIALANCGTPEPARPTLPSPEQDTCNVRQHAALIGQDVTALEKVLILGQVRVIRPETAVTLDYRAERVNFYITAGDQIARITCG